MVSGQGARRTSQGPTVGQALSVRFLTQSRDQHGFWGLEITHFHLTDVKTKALRIYRTRAPTQALRYYSLASFYNIRGFQIFFLFKKSFF